MAALQQRDNDKIANEQAKNNLESHIFETKDAMYSEAVVTVTTAEQREIILAALTEAGNWLEDDSYHAETSVRTEVPKNNSAIILYIYSSLVNYM